MNTKSHIAIKFEEIEVSAPAVAYVVILLYITGILPFIVVYTMFTFIIVVIDIGLPYFVQVIGGGALPASQIIGELAPCAPFLRLSMLHT